MLSIAIFLFQNNLVQTSFGQSGIAAPTNLQGNCGGDGMRLTFSWNAVSGAARYAIRIDDKINGWIGSAPLDGDTVGDVYTTSYQRAAIVGHEYHWWVHAVDASGNVSAASSLGVIFCVAWNPRITESTVSLSSVEVREGENALIVLSARGNQDTSRIDVHLIPDDNANHPRVSVIARLNPQNNWQADWTENIGYQQTGRHTIRFYPITVENGVDLKVGLAVDRTLSVQRAGGNPELISALVTVTPEEAVQGASTAIRFNAAGNADTNRIDVHLIPDDNAANAQIIARLSANNAWTATWNENVGRRETGQHTIRFYPLNVANVNDVTTTPRAQGQAVDRTLTILLPAPTGLTATCSNNTLNFSWSSVTGVTKYALRVDDHANGWNGSSPPDGDTVADVTTNSYSRPGVAGHEYGWWVHSVDQNDLTGPNSTLGIVTCPAARSPALNENTISMSPSQTQEGSNTVITLSARGNADTNRIDVHLIPDDNANHSGVQVIARLEASNNWTATWTENIGRQQTGRHTIRFYPLYIENNTIAGQGTPVDRVMTVNAGTPCSLKSQGDADCNGVVNREDYLIWKREYLGELTTRNADFNGDNVVDLIDYEINRQTRTRAGGR